MHSGLGTSRLLLMVAGVLALAYGILTAAVWANNAVMHSRDTFIGELDILGVPIIVDSPALGWIAGVSVVFGAAAVWKAKAETPPDDR